MDFLLFNISISIFKDQQKFHFVLENVNKKTKLASAENHNTSLYQFKDLFAVFISKWFGEMKIAIFYN